MSRCWRSLYLYFWQSAHEFPHSWRLDLIFPCIFLDTLTTVASHIVYKSRLSYVLFHLKLKAEELEKWEKKIWRREGSFHLWLWLLCRQVMQAWISFQSLQCNLVWTPSSSLLIVNSSPHLPSLLLLSFLNGISSFSSFIHELSVIFWSPLSLLFLKYTCMHASTSTSFPWLSNFNYCYFAHIIPPHIFVCICLILSSIKKDVCDNCMKIGQRKIVKYRLRSKQHAPKKSRSQLF